MSLSKPPSLFIVFASLVPAVSAASAAGTVDTAGFWVGFVLIFVVSALEAVASIIFTSYSITSDGHSFGEISCSICGREISSTLIGPQQAIEIANDETSGGLYTRTVSGAGIHSTSCGCCGWETKRTEISNEELMRTEIYRYGNMSLVPSLIIRRFNPATALKAPSGLVRNIKTLVWPSKPRTIERVLGHIAHLLVGLGDIVLGVVGLALNPSSPQNLYDTIKDPKAAMSFENYLNIFLIYWILGALLIVTLLPFQSSKKHIQILAWPGFIAYVIAHLASLALFGLGCWKIDYARKNHLPWTPMLSYWIGGASALSFPIMGIEVLHVFGLVGLIFMLQHTFS